MMSNIAISDLSLISTLMLMPIFIVGLYFLRKSKYFIRYFGVNTMLILYIACAFRLCVPIEFPKITLFIDDWNVFADWYSTLINKTELTEDLPIKLISILLIIWAISTAIYYFVIFFKYNKSTRFYLQSGVVDVSDEYITELEKVKTEIGIKEKVNLIVSNTPASAMSFGIFKKYIVLPNRQYTKQELYCILYHECTHIKNKDSMIKLLTELFVGLFWWNPFVYLLKKELSHVLEVKCDQCVLINKTKGERVQYFEILLNQLSLACSSKKDSILLTTEFAYDAEEKRTLQRFNCILEKGKATRKAVIINIVVLTCVIGLILSSYLIQWHPRYDAPDYDEYGNALSNEENAYVIHRADGSYAFVFEGVTVDIPAEEVEAGYYSIYPMIEEE